MFITLGSSRTRRHRLGVPPVINESQGVGTIGIDFSVVGTAETQGGQAGVGTITVDFTVAGIGGTNVGVGTATFDFAVAGTGTTGGSASSHTFFNTLIADSSVYRFWSLRAQTAADVTITGANSTTDEAIEDVLKAMPGGGTRIVSSTPGTPVRLLAARGSLNPPQIVRSINGVVKVDTNAGIPADGYYLEIIGHDVSALNGRHFCTQMRKAISAVSVSGGVATVTMGEDIPYLQTGDELTITAVGTQLPTAGNPYTITVTGARTFTVPTAGSESSTNKGTIFNNAMFTVTDVSTSAVGTAVGHFYDGHHQCHDGAVVDIADHVVENTSTKVIPDGRYTVQVVDERFLDVYHMDGTPVTTSAVGVDGTCWPVGWQYHPDLVPVSDPDDGLDAVKVVKSVYIANGNIARQLLLNLAPSQLSGTSMLHTWDIYLDGSMIQPNSGPVLPKKFARWDGTTIFQQWLEYEGRDLPIASVVPGASSTVTTKQPHYWSTGDSVQFTGNPGLSGPYTITVTGATTFTVPATGTSSAVGTVANTAVVGMYNQSSGGSGSGSNRWKWATGVTDAEETNYLPTGETGVSFSATDQQEGVYPIFADKWTRFWVWIKNDCTGDDFTSWNAWQIGRGIFPASHVIGKYNCTVSVSVGGVVTVTTSGPHGIYKLNDHAVKLSGTGLAGLDNVLLEVDTIPATPTDTAAANINGGFTGPSTFTLKGTYPALAGQSSSGVCRQLFNMCSVWIADEDRDPVCIYDQVPCMWGKSYDVFNHEWNSSNADDPAAQELHFYTRNHVLLTGTSGLMATPNLTNTTLFKRPVP